jgi:cellobiose-specific phosphotransferase system component IIC
MKRENSAREMTQFHSFINISGSGIILYLALTILVFVWAIRMAKISSISIARKE